ncbi:MAG: hypothetical protein Q4D51_12980 [Eubacteriales bacterium]|nr:hypothetical protein [Eubacteriales bacterium]
MEDWNGDGRIDAVDFMFQDQMEHDERHASTSHGGKAGAWFWLFFISIIIDAFCKGLGVFIFVIGSYLLFLFG